MVGGGGGAINVDLTLVPYKPSSSSSSSSSGSTNLPVSVSTNNGVTTASYSHRTCGTSSRTGFVHGNEERRERPNFEAVFGHPPSRFEVGSAFAALKQELIFRASRRIVDMLRDPSIQRLVVSLSSDQTLWNAIMSNEMVRKLLDFSTTGENYRLQSSDEEPDVMASILKRVMSIVKAKVAELIKNFLSLMEDVSQIPEKQNRREETTVEVDHKVKSSLLLSIVIVLIVVLARAQQA